VQRTGDQAFVDLHLPTRCAAVYLALLSDRRADETCQMSFPYLADLARLSPSTAERAVADLIECHVIWRRRVPFKANIYIFDDAAKWTPGERTNE
jgi:predicted transcriptional regulator